MHVPELWARMFQMYSVYNILFVATILSFHESLPWWWIEFVRANAFVVSIAIIFYYLHFGTHGIQDAYYKFTHMHLPLWIILVIELMAHIGPLLLVGLPSSVRMLWIAYGCFLAWYIFVVRKRFHKIYFHPIDPQKLDHLFFVKGIFFIGICTYLLW